MYFAHDWILEGPSLCWQCPRDKCPPHLQACHVKLWASSHGGSLLQDKALGAGRHCRPCSSSAWLRVKWVFAYWENQDPPWRDSLHSTWKQTHIGLTVGTFMIRLLWLLRNILFLSSINRYTRSTNATIQLHSMQHRMQFSLLQSGLYKV